ncbi:MAG: LD-carboxypeptidase [Chryseobacterium sp.]|nr:MAG: LD-carboxypeptidase [Chryseobacterium sp.]
MKIQFPSALPPGSKIAVISPAGAVESGQLDDTLQLIRSRGFEPVIGRHVYTKYSSCYAFAGTEEERIADLQWALDGDFASVWASRGGYGCAHLIERVNLDRFCQRPKWYIGYSDNTVLQSWLMRNGFASIHGQTIKTASFGVSKESYDGIFKILGGELPSYSISTHTMNRNGEARGRLVGGNLALVYSLLGTPYSFDFDGNILFIEDIGENFYALDRMLMSLELTGVFSRISAMVVGGMTQMEKQETNPDYDESFDNLAYETIRHRIEAYDFPVAFGFPNGHIFDNRPLIVGAMAELKIGSDGAALQFKKE